MTKADKRPQKPTIDMLIASLSLFFLNSIQYSYVVWYMYKVSCFKKSISELSTIDFSKSLLIVHKSNEIVLVTDNQAKIKQLQIA